MPTTRKAVRRECVIPASSMESIALKATVVMPILGRRSHGAMLQMQQNRLV